MYSLYKQDIIFIIILDRVPPSLNKLYYYYYHCLPTPTPRVCKGRRSLIWEIHFTSKGVGELLSYVQCASPSISRMPVSSVILQARPVD